LGKNALLEFFESLGGPRRGERKESGDDGPATRVKIHLSVGGEKGKDSTCLTGKREGVEEKLWN